MDCWLRRSRARTFVAGLSLLALLASESSARVVRPRHDEAFRSPEHSQVFADTGSVKRTLTVQQPRSLVAARVGEDVSITRGRRPRSLARQAIRTHSPLPPARMRYRRTTHDDDGEPPA